jgi:hypothetical protein
MKRQWLYPLGLLTLSASALLVPACSGDDNSSTGTTDSGTPDATTSDVVTTDSPTTDGRVAADGAADAAKDTGASQCAVYDAAGLDDASVAAGFQAVWKVYRCWGCHQKTSQIVDDAGKGIVLSGNNDGLGDSGTIFPPNLTNDPQTGLGCWSNAQISTAMLDGNDPDGGSLCPPMSKLGHALFLADGGPKPGTPMDAAVAQEVIDFLRSLPPVVNQVNDTTCPKLDGGAGTDAAGDGGTDASATDGSSTDGSSADAGTDAGDAASE